MKGTEFDLRPSTGGVPSWQSNFLDRNPKRMGSSSGQSSGDGDDGCCGDNSSSDSDLDEDAPKGKGRKVRKRNRLSSKSHVSVKSMKTGID